MKYFFLLMGCIAIAQSPQKFSYQALLRNSSNLAVVNQYIGIRISFFRGAISGNSVYSETHQVTTNSYGLLTLSIGEGVVDSTQLFSAIDWENGPYFIKTETDLTGGSNYTIEATGQFLAVLYDIYANTATIASNGLQSGNSSSSILFWNGYEWVELLRTTQDGAILEFINGVPSWVSSQCTL